MNAVASFQDPIWLVSEGGVLAPAVAAALRATGWQNVWVVHVGPELTAHRDLPQRPWMERGEKAGLVLLASEDGRLPACRERCMGKSYRRVVAIGGRQAYVALAAAVEQGARALDAEQPFPALIRKLQQSLVHPFDPATAASLAATLREREREAQLFTHLSARELDILCDLVQGMTAAEIAASEYVSMATVRSHIRSVLRKLGVSAQLAAVAMTYRSCQEAAVVERTNWIHQSWG